MVFRFVVVVFSVVFALCVELRLVVIRCCVVLNCVDGVVGCV